MRGRSQGGGLGRFRGQKHTVGWDWVEVGWGFGRRLDGIGWRLDGMGLGGGWMGLGGVGGLGGDVLRICGDMAVIPYWGTGRWVSFWPPKKNRVTRL